jgi:hypothetical protein
MRSCAIRKTRRVGTAGLSSDRGVSFRTAAIGKRLRHDTKRTGENNRPAAPQDGLAQPDRPYRDGDPRRRDCGAPTARWPLRRRRGIIAHDRFLAPLWNSSSETFDVRPRHPMFPVPNRSECWVRKMSETPAAAALQRQHQRQKGRLRGQSPGSTMRPHRPRSIRSGLPQFAVRRQAETNSSLGSIRCIRGRCR